MAIPCKACDKPVHEHAVVCPHCGDESGVPRDPAAERAIAKLRPVAAPSVIEIPSMADPLTSAVALGVAKVIGAALELVAKDEPAEPVPRAIARERQRTAKPHDDREPEPEPNPQPRILK